jgi:DNA polymerase delta subunit 3
LLEVTTEEPVWESFSEEEPEPSKSKTGTPMASSIGPSKSKKSASKPGQGNIMTFFAKK